jgi:ligand-binding sensor domain-containing protein/signal transduction histidine kinase
MLHKKAIYLVIVFEVLLINLSFSQKNQITHLYKFSNDQVANVTSITKDKKNFIWISTQGGVFRFDSKNWVKTPIRDGANNWSAIRKICYNDTTDQLVIISPDKGLAVLNSTGDTAFFGPLDLPPGIGPGDIFNIEPLNESFVLATRKGIFIIGIDAATDKKKPGLKVYSSLLNIQPLLFKKISNTQLAIVDQDNNLVVYEVGAAHSLRSLFRSALATELTGVTELFTLAACGNSFFIGSNKGLLVIDKQGDQVSFRQLLQDQVVYALAHTGNGNCWIAANEGFFKLTTKGVLINIENNSTNPNDDCLKAVYSIYPDDKDNIWLGTQNGLAVMEDRPAAFYSITNTHQENRALNHVYHLGMKENGTLLISCENGLYRFDADHRAKVIARDNTFFLNFTGPHHETIVSDLTNSYVLSNDSLTDLPVLFPEFRPYKTLSFNDYEYFNDSIVLLSTEDIRGVLLWNYKKKEVRELRFKDGTKIEQVNTLYKIANTLFILTDSTVLMYDTELGNLTRKIVRDEKTGLRYGLFFDMVQIGEHYYLSSYGNGILVTDTNFKVQRSIDESNGLSDNGVYRILPAGDSVLYISTNNGINVLKVRSGKLTTLYMEDGLHNNTFEEFSSLEHKGILYFGGKGGVTIIDPAKIRSGPNSAGLVFLDYKIVDLDNSISQISLLDKVRIDIPNNITQTTIYFQDIVYPFNNKVKYAYKIAELHKEWIHLNTQNFITLIGLYPGTYHLEVTALNEEGTPGEIKELTLVFRPKWFQTQWFKLLMILLIIALGYGAYRIRINQLKHENQIRSKLASDLHDDLGSTMNSVKVYANLAIMDRGAEKYLFKIKESAQEAIVGIRDIIWVLDDSKDTIEDLFTRVSSFASSLCEANNITYKLTITQEARDHKLGQAERRNLYMILKEAVNNAIKYAEGRELVLTAALKKGKPEIQIRDDGKGFDTNHSTEGNGLSNMRRRAKEIKYDIRISSAPGNGTTIYFQKM